MPQGLGGNDRKAKAPTDRGTSNKGKRGGSSGPSKHDGRANTNAGTGPKLKNYFAAPAKILRRYGGND